MLPDEVFDLFREVVVRHDLDVACADRAGNVTPERLLQWDPDHDPHGNPVTRRAVQLGLRGRVLASYAQEWIRRVEDITDVVREQHGRLCSGGIAALETPIEHVYPCLPSSKIGADSWP